MIRQVAAANDVLLIDLAKAVPQESKFMYDAVHYNDTGSELAASIISERLMSLPLVSVRDAPRPQTQEAH